MNILTNPTNGVAVNLQVNPSEQERTALIKELVDYNQRWEWLALCFGCNPIPVEAVHVF